MEQWVEKYRPQTLEQIILDKNLKQMLQEYIDKKILPNILLSGKQGIGKTALAKILVKETNAALLYINAGYDNGVDTIRTKVKDFCDTIIPNHPFKVVILDEADSLSGSGTGSGTGSSAQHALRNIIEESSDDTRFILTCNARNKIIAPIQSRCVPFDITFTLEIVLSRLLEILKNEKIKFSKKDFLNFVNQCVKKKFPDIRTCIGELQNWSISGTLTEYIASSNNIKELLEFIKNENDWRNIKKYVLENESLFNRDYTFLLQQLFNIYDDEDSLLIISEHVFRMCEGSDVEIEFTAMLIKLKRLTR